MYTFIYVYLYIYVYIYMYVYIYILLVCMYVCLHVIILNQRISGQRKCKIDFLNWDQKLILKCNLVFIFKENIYGRAVLSRVTENFPLTTEFWFSFFVRKVSGIQICKLSGSSRDFVLDWDVAIKLHQFSHRSMSCLDVVGLFILGKKD